MKPHTPEQAAEYLGVPVRTLADWRYRGLGPRYSKVGRYVRYTQAQLDAYLAESEVTPVPAA